MNKNDKMVVMLGSSSAILLLGSMMETDGSFFMELVRGIIVGMGLVFCCASLWKYGKSRREQA
ncbi:hypothetical protein J2T13_001494 [Paenibacillus sp. DS2015]|uniref:hypothetical protein n=1 Tax=Paenibacillus sp. DS2015 TaxID=3373917 RepID=UPI003D244D37